MMISSLNDWGLSFPHNSSISSFLDDVIGSLRVCIVLNSIYIADMGVFRLVKISLEHQDLIICIFLFGL